MNKTEILLEYLQNMRDNIEKSDPATDFKQQYEQGQMDMCSLIIRKLLNGDFDE